MKNKRLWGLIVSLLALVCMIWLPTLRPMASGIMAVGLFVLIRGKLG